MPSSYNKTTIALDYDGTVTSDRSTHKAIVDFFRSNGHVVYIVTMRFRSECERDPDFMAFAACADGVICTDRMPKRTACNKQGIFPHIWIDDNPQAVDMSAVQIWGAASPEGSVVTEVHENDQPSSITVHGSVALPGESLCPNTK